MSCRLAFALMLGVLWARHGGRSVGLPAAVLVFAAVFPQLLKGHYRECVLRGALLLAAGALGAGCYIRHTRIWEAERQAFVQGQQVCVRGTLIRKEQKKERWQLTLELPGYKNQVLVSAESGGYPLDCVLSVEGTVREFQTPRNEGQFNEQSYYKYRQVVSRVDGERVVCIRAPTGIRAWREQLFLLRRRLCGVYEAGLPAPAAGILSAMAAGEKSLLDADVRALFQRAGISHILAISGLHISMIGMGIYALLRRFGCPYTCSAAVTAGFLLLYGTMIGMGVSACRAIGMFFLFLLAQCMGRGYDTCAALAVMAAVLLVCNPFRLFDVSFQFSFLAVFAVVTAGAVLPEKEGRGRLYASLRPVLVSLLLQLLTLPLVAYYYYELPVYALFLNLLLLPYLGAALGFGLAGGCMGLFLPSAGCLLLVPSRLVLRVYVWSCDLAGQLPFSTVICGRPSAGKLCVYYGLLALLLGWLYHRTGRDSEDGKVKGVLAADCLGCAAGAAALLALLCHVSGGGFEIDYLDVGQGDGSLLRTQDGIVCFVDGGSSDVSGVGTYRVLPFLKSKGIRKVDYWILSHLDEDHVNGFYEVLEAGYRIGAVVVSVRMPEDEAKERLREALAEYGVPLLSVDGGDILQLHNRQGADTGAKISFLSPSADTPAHDGNGASLVCLYGDDTVRALWTGDIGEQQERWLVNNGLLSQVDIYKAAHHGSKYSSSAEYLQTLSPGLSVVSCGEHNRYGHPGAEAVANMEASGSRILYTMKSGQITVRRSSAGLVYRVFCAE